MAKLALLYFDKQHQIQQRHSSIFNIENAVFKTKTRGLVNWSDRVDRHNYNRLQKYCKRTDETVFGVRTNDGFLYAELCYDLAITALMMEDDRRIETQLKTQ